MTQQPISHIKAPIARLEELTPFSVARWRQLKRICVDITTSTAFLCLASACHVLAMANWISRPAPKHRFQFNLRLINNQFVSDADANAWCGGSEAIKSIPWPLPRNKPKCLLDSSVPQCCISSGFPILAHWRNSLAHRRLVCFFQRSEMVSCAFLARQHLRRLN